MAPVTEKIKSILAKVSSAGLPQQGISLAGLLRRPEISYEELRLLTGDEGELPEEVKEQVEIQVKYEGYIKKQRAQVERFERMEGKKLPKDIDYGQVKGISVEAKEKLEKVRPGSIGQAVRIAGVSPADISVLLIYLEQKRRRGEKRKLQ